MILGQIAPDLVTNSIRPNHGRVIGRMAVFMWPLQARGKALQNALSNVLNGHQDHSELDVSFLLDRHRHRYTASWPCQSWKKLYHVQPDFLSLYRIGTAKVLQLRKVVSEF